MREIHIASMGAAGCCWSAQQGYPRRWQMCTYSANVRRPPPQIYSKLYTVCKRKPAKWCTRLSPIISTAKSTAACGLRHAAGKLQISAQYLSRGRPLMVAKVGRPQLMASTTVSPKASYSAGCTKRPMLVCTAHNSSKHGTHTFFPEGRFPADLPAWL